MTQFVSWGMIASEVASRGTDVTNTDSKDDGRAHLAALERGLFVLEILAKSQNPMTLAEVARASDLNRATARRILHTLVSTNYAVLDDKRFSPSTKILTLGRSIVQRTGFWGMATKHIREAARILNETCSAAILEGTEAVYVTRVPAAHRVITADLSVGKRLPAYCTSMGRVLLAGLSEDKLDRLLNDSRIVAYTEHTVTDPAILKDLIRDARQKGFAIVDQELEIGLRSVAVPILRDDGKVVAALNIASAPTHTSIERIMNEIIPELQRTAKDIQAAIDFA